MNINERKANGRVWELFSVRGDWQQVEMSVFCTVLGFNLPLLVLMLVLICVLSKFM